MPRPGPRHLTPVGVPRRRLLEHPRRLALALGLLAIGLLHLVNLNGWPIFFDDEGTYVAQAWATYQGELAHYTYWYDHPPGGWLQLAALMGIPQLLGVGPTVVVGRYVMIAYTLVAAALVYQLCRNLGLRHVTAMTGMLAWGLCPLVVYEGRQVMLDNLALPWVLGAFVLATARGRALWQHIAAGACLGMAVLTKETTVLLAPALLFALWSHGYGPTRRFSLVGAGMVIGLVGGVYPLFALLKNELTSGAGHVSLQDAISFQLVARMGSGNVLDANSPARGVIGSWLHYDHVLPISGVVAGLACLFVRRLRPIGLALVLMAVIALRPNGYLPLMYIIGVLPFAAVALAGISEPALIRLGRLRVKSKPVGVAAVAVVLLAALAYVAPGWLQRNATALTADSNDPYYAAVRYMDANLGRDTRILVDDAYWNTLVDHGWRSDGWNGPIWYFKLDLDPLARAANLENGWRDVDYIVVNDVMAANINGATLLSGMKAAYEHSSVVQQWGSGPEQVQLRKIMP
jgi:hypothetical protein